MIELEKTYLAKTIPTNLKQFYSKEIIDIYLPKDSSQPKLRLRKNGAKYEMTKKDLMKEGDASQQIEQTIILNETEYNSLYKQLDGKKIHKIRYYYDYNGNTAEIDVFQDELSNLVLIDFEFNNNEEKENFKKPDFCLAEVTQENFIAGGMICGKKYEDIETDLKRFNYKKINILLD